MKRYLMFTWSIILLSQATAFAQVPLSPEVQEAIRQAIIKDAEVKNQDLELDKMELQRKTVLSKYIPKVEARALYAHFNSDVTVDIPTKNVALPGIPEADVNVFDGEATMNNYGNVFHGGVSAHAVLFSGGQILNGAKALNEKNKGTALMMQNRKDEVIQTVLESYDQLQLLRSAERLIEESTRRLEKETQRVEKAIAAGLAIPYDREKIKLAQLELESKRTDVQHKQELLSLKIAQETGLDPEAILRTAHQVNPILIARELHADQRNEIKALEHFKTASEYNIKKEKGSLLPNIGAFGGYSYSSLFDGQAGIPLSYLDRTTYLNLNRLTLNPTWTIGVGLKWEIFSGFERKHKIQEARISLQQVENKLSDAREKVELQLKKNQIEYDNALDQVEIARQAEQIAENNNTLAEKQYQAGLITITERLTAENDLYAAALKRIEAVIAQRKAALETLQSAGDLATALELDI